MAPFVDADHVSRRHLLAGAVVVAASVAGCSRRDQPTPSRVTPMNRPAGVPLSQFGSESTAEDVTQGLDLTGKTALVTGATSGLGLETMRVLALRGAHVIGTGRTRESAAAACESVAPGRSTPLGFDLQKWDDVVAAARSVRALGRPLDVLVCNAGIMTPPALVLVNGLEQQFVVNHLGHFILCHHLLDAIKAAPQGRVIVVSSQLHTSAPPAGIDFDNLSGQRGYNALQMYGQSKLANALFAFELARRLAFTSTTVNTLHPGVVNTDLGRSREPWRRFAARLRARVRPSGKPVAVGASTQVYLASAPSLSAVSGYYFEDCNPVVPAGPHMQNRELAARLWATSAELTQAFLA